MIAYHIMSGLPVPMDSADFYKGLDERYLQRDSMYFLIDQVNEYDMARIKMDVEPVQFDLFVTNEKSAIAWLYQQLDEPKTYAEIQPRFMQEIKALPLKQAQQKEMPSALQTAPDEATSQSEQSGYGVASGKKVSAVSSEQTGEQSANAFIAPSRKAVATHLKSARSAQKKPAQTRQRKKQTTNTQQSRATKKAK